MGDRTRQVSELSLKLRELRRQGVAKPLTDAEIKQELAGIELTNRKADAVFEGGGVKGIALTGAIQVAECLGVEWQRVGGTSAGAITACLLAAGYPASELSHIITKEMDFKKFMDEGLIDNIPLLGKVISALLEKGIYEGDYFAEWMREKLAARGINSFGDLKMENGNYRLNLIASDVTRRKMLILPDDLPEHERDNFSVSHGARMSMSIPYFFEPVTHTFIDDKGDEKESYIVDGGLLSNYPVWLFDVASDQAPSWPTYGFKLIEPDSDDPSPDKWPHDFALSLVTTMMEAHDKAFIDQKNFERTIGIPTMGIQTTQFDISDEDKDLLIRAGQEAAIKFFKQLNMDKLLAG